MDKKDLKYYLSLLLLPGIGNITAKQLISYCGGVAEVFQQNKRDLKRIPDIGPKTAQSIIQCDSFDKAEAELKFIEDANIQVISYLDDRYPQRLTHCKDAPLVLFYKGEASLNKSKVISIVGTRRATEYGKSFCQELVSDLFPHDPLIVSGLAYGIDGCAHRCSLEERLSTVAVLGHGLDRIYPYGHRQLAQSMLDKGGGLLTEFPSGIAPDRENFPKRNRIIAGLADAVVVVQSGRKGGAMITADIANSYNRDVFALPGSIKDKRAIGCHLLIKSHQAALIETAKDIEYVMRWDISNSSKNNKSQALQLNLDKKEQQIVELLQNQSPLHVDEICYTLKCSSEEVTALLLQLEVAGIIKSLPGNQYKLK